MSHTSRRARRSGRHGASSVRAPHVAIETDPTAALRRLVEEGIITAAALGARDDLELAAASTQRLGTLTSGMWRALGRELATAAERLDRSSMDRLDDIDRRARLLSVSADDVLAAGFAAGHLAEHRERLESLVTKDMDVHLLLGPDMLFGFTIEPPEDDRPGSMRVVLHLWPAPLSPATVSIAPSVPEGTDGPTELDAISLDLGVAAHTQLLDALTTATGQSRDHVSQALSALGIACWTAHHLDEEGSEDEEEELDDGVEGDGGPAALDD
jgi:hypothetical protein